MKTSFTLSKLIPFVFIMGLFLMFEASAQQTKKISLQGFLKDANGKAVADGSQSMTFKLYTTATGGTAEWSEDQTLNVFGGVYSTHLGTNTNNAPGGVTDFGNLSWGAKTYYVGVTVQGTELTPRTELTFAPYSLGSPKAQEVVCSGAVGDVKYSILNPTQFAAVNGNCWVPMDGRTMVGSKLAEIIGGSSVPNAGGLFLRGQESQNGSTDNDPERTSASTIATLQDQQFLSHGHTHSLNASGNTSTNGNHTHGYERTSEYVDDNDGGSDHGNPNSTEFSKQTDAAGDHSHSFSVTVTGSVNNNGGNETRPKNLNLWTYIRIN